MPTGYTHAIEKGITFEQFVWSCARGMGALIMMRDDPTDAPIPERFEPSGTYIGWLAPAREKLTQLRAMTTEETEVAAAESYEKELSEYNKRIDDKNALRQKYEAMRDKVAAWKPPTAEHTGLRSFMLEQLSSSIDFDCRTDYMQKPTRLTGAEWHEHQIASARSDVERYAMEAEKEADRTESRNAWIAALRESVPYPADNGPKAVPTPNPVP